ncbi:MAG: hypothetical protein ACXVNM_13730 [Bacteroidia bacterium]
MNKLFFFILISFPLVGLSQLSLYEQRHKDSLRLKFQKDSTIIFGFKKIRPYINYHERNSIENPKTINFYGPQAGLLLFERHITGAGVYFSTANTKKPFESFDGNNPVIKRIDIKYFTVFYQYILLQYRYLEFHLPFEVGHGNIKTNYSDLDDKYYKTTKNNFTIASAGGQLILKPIRWLGFSAIYGYRIADEKIINGFYYAFGIWIGFKPLLIDINYFYTRKKYLKELIKITQG